MPANQPTEESSVALVSAATDVIATPADESQTAAATVESGTGQPACQPADRRISCRFGVHRRRCHRSASRRESDRRRDGRVGHTTLPANPPAEQLLLPGVRPPPMSSQCQPTRVRPAPRRSSRARQPCPPTRRPNNLLPPWCPPSPMSSQCDPTRVRLTVSPAQRTSWYWWSRARAMRPAQRRCTGHLASCGSLRLARRAATCSQPISTSAQRLQTPIVLGEPSVALAGGYGSFVDPARWPMRGSFPNLTRMRGVQPVTGR